MKLKSLFESPQETFPTDFGLDQPKVNYSESQKLLADARKLPIAKFGDGQATLYELPRKYFLIDNATIPAKLTYLMEYKVDYHNFLQRKCAQQIVVWSDTEKPFTEGLAKRVFFDHILKNWKTIITDSLQTPDGKRFWDRRVGDALNEGVYVYYVSFIPIQEIVRIHFLHEYSNLINDREIWGSNRKHGARRIVITSQPLPEIAR